jgi:hypothetical protein
MTIPRIALFALATALLSAPAGAPAQEEGGGIERYLEGLQREVEETAPVIVDEAREGLGTAERLGRNLVDRWRVCGEGPQSAAPACIVLTDGEGGPLDPSPGSLDRMFERLAEIAAPYNDRSRAAAALTEAWAEALGFPPDRYSADRAVAAVFDRIRDCGDRPCEALDRDLLRRTVAFLEQRDTAGYRAARRIRTAYGFEESGSE